MRELDNINYFSKNASTEVKLSLLKNFSDCTKIPVFACIGTDTVTGDSLGPLVGELLKNKFNIGAFVYGCFKNPISASKIKTFSDFLQDKHTSDNIVAIDAAVGKANMLGTIQIKNDGIFPGLATNKSLDKVGTHSIIGVVADQSYVDSTLLNFTRLGLVYDLANIIAEGISMFVCEKQNMLNTVIMKPTPTIINENTIKTLAN